MRVCCVWVVIFCLRGVAGDDEQMHRCVCVCVCWETNLPNVARRRSIATAEEETEETNKPARAGVKHVDAIGERSAQPHTALNPLRPTALHVGKPSATQGEHTPHTPHATNQMHEKEVCAPLSVCVCVCVCAGSFLPRVCCVCDDEMPPVVSAVVTGTSAAAAAATVTRTRQRERQTKRTTTSEEINNTDH